MGETGVLVLHFRTHPNHFQELTYLSKELAEAMDEPGHTQVIVMKRRDFKTLLRGDAVYSTFTYQGTRYVAVMTLDELPATRRPTDLMGYTPLYLGAPKSFWQSIKRGSTRVLTEKIRLGDGGVLYLTVMNEATYKMEPVK